MFLFRSGYAFDHSAAGSGDAAQTRARSFDAVHSGGARSGEKLHLLSVTRIRTCGTGMDPELFYVYGRTEPDDAV